MKRFYFFLLLLLTLACSKESNNNTIGDPNTVMKEELIEMKTSYGDMYIWLYKATPKHRNNFLKLAREGFYDSTTFHRIISGFMIQGGDPNSKDADTTNDGTGGPGYRIEAEIIDSIKHERGSLAAARTNNPAKESSGSQFYICHSTSGTAHLNGNYTVYGMVMKGIEVVDSIVRQPKNQVNRPLKDIKMDVNVLEMSKEKITKNYGYTDFK